MPIVVFTKIPAFAGKLMEKLETGDDILCFSSLKNAREMSKYCNPKEIILDIHSLTARDIESLANWPQSLIGVTVMATAEAPVKTRVLAAGIYKFNISQLSNQQLVVGAGI